MSVDLNPVKIVFTNKCQLPKTYKKIELGGIMGHTGTGSKTYIAEVPEEAICGVINAFSRLNVFNATSHTTLDPIKAQSRTVNSIIKTIYDLRDSTNNNLCAFLLGGLGSGAKRNSVQIEQSRNLCNDIAYGIEDCLPKREGFRVPLAMICGIKDAIGPLKVYVRNRMIVLEGHFDKLFNKTNERNLNQADLEIYFENVQLPNGVQPIAIKNFDPKKDTRENQRIINEFNQLA